LSHLHLWVEFHILCNQKLPPSLTIQGSSLTSKTIGWHWKLQHQLMFSFREHVTSQFVKGFTVTRQDFQRK
jgi:hypothetical protein